MWIISSSSYKGLSENPFKLFALVINVANIKLYLAATTNKRRPPAKMSKNITMLLSSSLKSSSSISKSVSI